MDAIKMLNLLTRFLLELCILVIFGYLGFKIGRQTLTRIILGIGTPLIFAVVWGTFLAPKSSMRLHEPWLFIVEVIIFGLAAWALYSIDKISIAIIFGSIYILNKILMVLWRQG